jgi:hypothetical protein
MQAYYNLDKGGQWVLCYFVRNAGGRNKKAPLVAGLGRGQNVLFGCAFSLSYQLTPQDCSLFRRFDAERHTVAINLGNNKLHVVTNTDAFT